MLLALLVSVAVLMAQISPSFAAVQKVKRGKMKYETRHALVLLTPAQFEQIKSKRKDLRKAFDSAAKTGTKVKVSARDAKWLMAQSRMNGDRMKGAGVIALATIVPFIVMAIPIVYTMLTGEDFITKYPFFGLLVCAAGAFFYQPLQASCTQLFQSTSGQSRGNIGLRFPNARSN
jgi:hypothetical protein